MDERKQAADELQLVFSGRAWHGPSLRTTLRGITAHQAAHRVISNAHTIWEIVEHLRLTERLVYDRLHGQRFAHSSPTEL